MASPVSLIVLRILQGVSRGVSNNIQLCVISENNLAYSSPVMLFFHWEVFIFGFLGFHFVCEQAGAWLKTQGDPL